MRTSKPHSYVRNITEFIRSAHKQTVDTPIQYRRMPKGKKDVPLED